MNQTTLTSSGRTTTGSRASWQLALRVRQLRQHPRALRRRTVDNVSHTAIHSKILQSLSDVRLHTSVGGTALVSKECNWRKDMPISGIKKKERSLSQVYWKAENGTLCSTLSMSQFSALKAATPLVKVTLYGICRSHQPTNCKIPLEISLQLSQNEEAISLGYFFIDLRTPNLSARWTRVMNAAISAEVMFESSFSVQETNEQLAPTSYTSGQSHATRENKDDCLQLGRDNGQDVFVISIKIRDAKNLHSALPNQNLSSLKEYWLSYSFFDLVIQTDAFIDLKSPTFPPIKDNFRIRSSPNDLREFLRNQKLVIYLCAQDEVFGDVEVPFSGLFTQSIFSADISENEANSAVVEDCLVFDKSAQPLPFVTVEVRVLREKTTKNVLHPGIEISGSLKEDIRSPEPTDTLVETSEHVHGTRKMKIQHLCVKKSFMKTFALLGIGEVELEACLGSHKDTGSISWLAMTPEHYYGRPSEVSLPILTMKETEMDVKIAFIGTTDYGERIENFAFLTVPTSDTLSPIVLSNQKKEEIGSCSLRSYNAEKPAEIMVEIEQEEAFDSVYGSGIQDSRISHRFHLMIDFEAIQLGQDSSSTIIFEMTNPLLDIDKVRVGANIRQRSPKKIILSNTYCKYAVTTSEATLPDMMKEHLHVTILGRNALKDLNGDEAERTKRIGEAVFSLNYLFFAREFYCCGARNCDATFASHEDAETHQCESNTEKSIHACKSCTLNLPIVSNVIGSDGQKAFGSVDIAAYIEDCGAGNLVSHNAQVESFFTEKTRRTQPLIEQKGTFIVGSNNSELQGTLYDYSLTRECTSSAKMANEKVEEIESVIPQNRDDAVVNTPSVTPLKSPPQQDSFKVKAKLNELSELKQYLLDEHDKLVQKQARREVEQRRKLLENETNRIKVLEEEWAKKEVERNTIVHGTQKEYLKLERQLRSSLAELESRKRQFETERAEHERNYQLEHNEIDLLRKQLYVERQNAEAIDKQRAMVLKKQVASLNAQLSASEKKNKRLEAEFVEFQEQQCNISKAKLREEIFSLRTTIQLLEKEKKGMTEAHNATTLRLGAMQKQLDNLSKLLEIEKIKSQTKALDELENIKLSCTAKEEKAVLAYEGAELREIKSQLEQLRQIAAMRKHHRLDLPQEQFDDSVRRKSQPNAKARNKLPSDRSSGSGSSIDEDPVITSTSQKNKALIKRLKRERAFLLSCGQYDRNSELVKELDRLLHVTIESCCSKAFS